MNKTNKFFSFTKQNTSSPAFTIVELLIVIVVIGILASITIVAYNGIQNRARSAATSSALNQAAKKLAVHHVDSSTYPTSLSDIGISDSSGVTYKYYPNNPTTPTGYCMTATNAGTTYSVSSSSAKPQDGDCTTNGLAGWWQFDGNANDSSGNGNNGSLIGVNPTTDRQSASDAAYEFAGAAANSYIDLGTPDSLQFDDNKPITVAAWIHPYQLTTRDTIFTKNNNRGSPYTYMFILFSGDMSAYTGSAWRTQATGGAITVNNWHHVAFAFDGKRLNYYLNGNLLGSNTNFTYTNKPAHTNKISGYSATTDFNGKIDDVRVYNRSLSANEVSELHQSN